MRPRSLPPRARWLLPLLLVALVAASVYRLSRPAPEPEQGQPDVADAGAPDGVTSLQGDALGTTYSAKLALPAGVSAQAAHDALRGALSAVDAAMSTYRADSELSRWNAAEPHVARPVSDELRRVFEIALQVGHASDGALDVTIAPLVDAWGFGPAPRKPPTDAELTALRAQTGLDKIALGPQGLSKRVGGVRCDLSAVAKGYAVDRVAAALSALGIERFLVEVGGELITAGTRPDGQPWRVAIERPTPERRSIERVLPLVDQGLATSGDYRNYYEIAGKRVSHLIDPRTGRPIEHALASVSVVHPQVAFADAWATALSVLGPERGRQVAEHEQLLAFFIVREGDSGFRTFETRRFAQEFSDN